MTNDVRVSVAIRSLMALRHPFIALRNKITEGFIYNIFPRFYKNRLNIIGNVLDDFDNVLDALQEYEKFYEIFIKPSEDEARENLAANSAEQLKLNPL
jgi:hypothetical protein